jgi:cardiolipin synthase
MVKSSRGSAWKKVLVGIGLALITLILIILMPPDFKRVERRIPHTFGVADPEFVQTMGALLGPSLTRGNRATEYRNGDQIFPAMLKAIASAKRTITMESYIYWEGEVGRRFTEALSERARAGVKVHLLLDWVGTGKIDGDYLDVMKAAGVEVERYHRPHWYTISRINNRTHRKLLVVDGLIGFTGGVGIADEWLGSAQDSLHWRDSHFAIEGPAVAQMQAGFMDNWLEKRADVLVGDAYFPPLDSVGPQLAQVFLSSPTHGSESVRLMYLLSIAAAKRSILLGNAYFIPDDLATKELIAARSRGVEVDIVVPGPHIDTKTTQRASRSRWGPLLAAGVRIHEFQPTMYHSKIMVVDEIWASVGSTNFDDRSFRLNDEANLNIYDAAFAMQLATSLRLDIAKSKPMTLERWQARPRWERFKDWLAGLFRSQL